MDGDRPLCYVLMPYGIKRDPAGGADIDFDTIYEQAIRPAIAQADLEPIRGDEELTGGIIHKPMFERLLLCDFAVADLTTANSNVFYELGVRHAARPATTLMIFANQQRLPFDVGFLRALPYQLGDGNRFGAGEAGALSGALTKRLRELRETARDGPAADSPVFQLLEGYGAPDIARLKTDVFRQRARYSAEIQEALSGARRRGSLESLVAIETGLGPLDAVEVGVLVDLFLSYRAVKAWQRMIDLFRRLPVALQRTVMVREQFAFALNRQGESETALEILERVIRDQGPSSETYGLIGRIYKDRWADARKAGNDLEAEGCLTCAIDNYVRGFEADWRDAYPGINAVTLLDVKGDAESLGRQAELLPVVRFAVNQRLRSAKPDYWDHATLLELAVLAGDEKAAGMHCSTALASMREKWEAETTANNLRLIREARQRRGRAEPWLDTVIEALERKAG
jgi:tetratricopeptide (TPR) repeat protein